MVREKISKEGVGDEPGAAPGSPPSSGGTDRRRPGRVRPRRALSCMPDGRPRPAFRLVLGGGEGRGGENPGWPEDRGSLGGPTHRRPEAGTARRFGHGALEPPPRLPYLRDGGGPPRSAPYSPRRVGAGATAWGVPGVRGPPEESPRATARRSPPKSTVFGLLSGPRPPGGPRTPTAPPPPPPSRRSASVEGWVGRLRRTVAPLWAPESRLSIDSHVNEKSRSTSRKKYRFWGVFDLTSVSAVPENPPEVFTSSYIPPGGSNSQKTRISPLMEANGGLCLC